MESQEYKNKKNVEIEKINTQNSFIQKIVQVNNNVSLLDSESINEIKDIYVKNKKYLHKLKTNEFEIAIVGLEKAGKSTFVNALILNNILPSDTERCTYTQTKLTYSDEDKGIVTFYTYEEFNRNFKSFLADLEYPNLQDVSFESINIEEFQNYCKKLESDNPSLFKLQSTTIKDIKETIKEREEIKKLLDLPPKVFSGEESLRGDEFKSYIRGEGSEKENNKRTSRPRSVKIIEIQSSKLQKLENAIIYDVPGFNSPTKIHEKQTLERLKSADAIVLLLNAGQNPSLTEDQLSIITKNTDEDGILLKEKLFVFGNLLDKVNSQEDIQGNLEILKNNVEEHNVGERKRVYGGSAYKYLVIDNKIMVDEKSKNFQVMYEMSSGIEEIYNGIVDYYENERFLILQRKIYENEKKLNHLLDTILRDLSDDFDPNFPQKRLIIEKNKILINSLSSISNDIYKNLIDLKARLKKEIKDETYFSKKFENSVDKEGYFPKIKKEDLEEIKKEVELSVTDNLDIERINQEIRTRLHKKYLENFSDLIVKMTDEKAKTIQMEIVDIFTKAVLGGNSGGLFSDIREDSEKLITKLTKNIGHNEGRFIYLIERFSRNVFDILIAYPLFSLGRIAKFKTVPEEFGYLDSFYENEGSLISLLLMGSDDKLSLDSNSNHLEKKVKLLLNMAKTITPQSDETKMEELRNKLAELNEEIKAYNNKSINIDYLLKDKKPNETEEKVLEEINNDIENLKIILNKAVLPAINLELAFLNGIDKQLKILISASNLQNRDNKANLFREFMSEIIAKIKEEEFKRIDDKLEDFKNQQKLLEEIKKYRR